MSCHLADWLAKMIIGLIYRLLFLIFCFRGNLALFQCLISDPGAIICFIGYALRNNVHGSGDGFLYRCHTFFLRQITFCLCFQRCRCHLKKNNIGQTFQSFLFCHSCTSPAFWTIWTIKVIHSHLCLRCLDRCFELFRQFPLLLNAGDHLCLLIFQISKIGQPLTQITKLLVIKRTSSFLPVTGNERDGISLINQFDCCFHLPFLHLKFFCQFLYNIHKKSYSNTSLIAARNSS